MNMLYDAAAMLVLAAGLVLLILLGLHLAAPTAVRGDEPERPRPRPRKLETAAVCTAFLLTVFATAAVQTAYGAPMGERSSTTMEVVAAGDCDRPVAGLGIVVRCEPEVWISTVPFEYRLDGVVGGAAVQPGTKVAEYRLTGWWSALNPVRPQSQWRDTADESKTDLLWLSALPLAGVFAYLFFRRGRSA
ncbi:MAG: hypothetical protein HOQ43_03205 [Glycomyces artemisiae]|uniref:Uncharacterized protein n=1 Tax=Glycomyces artemisiae TaxID=1076443 RepID=A0A850C7B7_9ACTN|nr:hypothetical protein [Glycomyces artemisiae]